MNGKESSHSAHGNGMDERIGLVLCFLRTRSFSEKFFDAFFAFVNTVFRPLRITVELLVKSLHLAVQVK